MKKKKLFTRVRPLRTGLENSTKDKAHDNHVKMTEGQVPFLILSLSASTIFTMLIATTYNLVDTYFVSSLGKSQIGAVGVMFSAMALIQAVGYTFGMGAASLISRYLGKEKRENAEQTLACAFAAALVTGTIIGIFGLIYIKPLIGILGATDTIKEYAYSYGAFVIAGTPVMCGAYVLNNSLRAEGKPYLALLGIFAGGALNALLDFILIKVFNIGIMGAGIATLAGQSLSLIIMIICFRTHKSVVKLKLWGFRPDLKVIFGVIRTGIPSFWRQGLMCLAGVFLNRSCRMYGDDVVAAMSIANKIFAVIFAILVGYGQGFAPVAGYNYGAKLYGRVRTAVKTSVITATIAMLIIGTAIYYLSPSLIGLFTDDAQVSSVSILALKAHAISLPFMPVCIMVGMLYQAVGRIGKAAFISSLRQGIFFLPLIYILPAIYHATGIAITQAAADILAGLTALATFATGIRHGDRSRG